MFIVSFATLILSRIRFCSSSVSPLQDSLGLLLILIRDQLDEGPKARWIEFLTRHHA